MSDDLEPWPPELGTTEAFRWIFPMASCMNQWAHPLVYSLTWMAFCLHLGPYHAWGPPAILTGLSVPSLSSLPCLPSVARVSCQETRYHFTPRFKSFPGLQGGILSFHHGPMRLHQSPLPLWPWPGSEYQLCYTAWGAPTSPCWALALHCQWLIQKGLLDAALLDSLRKTDLIFFWGLLQADHWEEGAIARRAGQNLKDLDRRRNSQKNNRMR